jgi:poly-beta-1,6-N-acetyl-D-glucosamine synthase
MVRRRDFIRQRRRIAAGHYWLRAVSGYAVSTLDLARLVRVTASALPITQPKLLAYALGTIGLEAFCRGLGYFDFLTDKQHAVWQISETTKAVMTDEIRPLYQGEDSTDGVAEDMATSGARKALP